MRRLGSRQDWGLQTISSSQVRVELLPIITSENNNALTRSHAHKHSHTLIWCQPATESPFLFLLLHAEARPPERSPAAADEPTVVQLQGQLLYLQKKVIGVLHCA